MKFSFQISVCLFLIISAILISPLQAVQADKAVLLNSDNSETILPDSKNQNRISPQILCARARCNTNNDCLNTYILGRNCGNSKSLTLN